MWISFRARLSAVFCLLALAALAGAGLRWAKPASAPADGFPAAGETYLAALGWEAVCLPEESGERTIPGTFGPVWEKYNALQLSQGFDLSPYRGKTVRQYAYRVLNHPGAADGPVTAHLLVWEGAVIGGDVGSPRADGFLHGLKQGGADDPAG